MASSSFKVNHVGQNVSSIK